MKLIKNEIYLRTRELCWHNICGKLWVEIHTPISEQIIWQISIQVKSNIEKAIDEIS